MANYNISTNYETQENNDDRNFLEKAFDTIWWAAHVVSNRLFWDKDASLKKAQDAQLQIDTLKERYYNWENTVEERNNITQEISNLKKIRDDALSSKDLWASDRWDWLMRQWNPITENDIYEYARTQAHSQEDWNALQKDAWKDTDNKTQNKVNFLKSVLKQNQEDDEKNLLDQYKNAVKTWEATFDSNWQWFLDWYTKNIQPKWVQWYTNQFKIDVLWKIEPKDIILTQQDWTQRIFFKDDASQFIDNLIYSDDIYKAIESNYNVVKKVEWWLNSDNESEKKYAESDYTQKIYNNAVKNLNNLKDEVSYIYDNFEKYDWDMFEIENQYKIEKWRKMFSDASNWDSSVFIRTPDEEYSSEDWWTSATKWLNVDSRDYIKEEYPNTWQTVWWNIISPVKHAFNIWAFALNTVTNSIEDIRKDFSVLRESFYNMVLDVSTWEDVDYIRQTNTKLMWENREAWKEYASNIEWWMSSVQSLKDKILDDNKWWNKVYNNILAASDASPTLAKETLLFVVSEWLMNSMWVTTTAEMLRATALGSNKYAKIIWYNNWLLKFSGNEIIRAKLLEFAWRWVIQNAMLSASANANFSEDYSDLDFWLDLAFAFLDAFSLAYWTTIWKQKIFQEWQKAAQRKMLREAIRDVLPFTDDQWQILITWFRDQVDIASAELWKYAADAIRQKAKLMWVPEEVIINEMIKGSKNKTNITQLVTKWYRSLDAQTIVHMSKESIDALRNAYEQLINWALFYAVHSEPWKYSKSIIDKIWIAKVEAPNWTVDTRFYWKKDLTYEEFEEIISKVNQPTLKKLWKQFQDVVKNKEVVEREKKKKWYTKETEDIEKVDTSTIEWQVEADIKTTDLSARYDNLLRQNLAKNVPTDQFRRWEYEKYWRPNWYEYWDMRYTVYWVSDNVQVELEKRIKEFANDYDEFFSTNKEIKYENPSNWAIPNKGNVKLSEDLLKKENLIWLSFEEAKKLNKNLSYVTEWFFRNVTNSWWLELYQKNAILWSIPDWWKFPSPNWVNIILDLKKWDNYVFWSSFEEDYIVGKYWSVWIVWIQLPDWTLKKWAYIKYKDHINVRWEDFEYNFKLKNWTIVSNSDMKIWFVPPNNFRYSFDLKLYNDLEKVVEDIEKEHPKEMWIVDDIQTIETILNKDWHKWSLKNINERNRYQSEDHDYYFWDRMNLMLAERDSWYINVLNLYNIPFSYFVEIRKDIAKWRLQWTREWANQILLAAWCDIKENKSYFIIDENSLINEKMLYFMFHQAWIILLPDLNMWLPQNIQGIWYRAYVYERIPWTEWRYNIYTSENKDVPITEIWVNIKTWRSYIVNPNTKQVERLGSFRLSKKQQIDVDSDMYTIDVEWKYNQKRDWLFNDLQVKEKRWTYNVYETNKNFNIESPQEVADKFKIITIDWWWWNYNKDIKVKEWNKRWIKNIYNFKNLSLRLWKWDRKQVSQMFYDWLNTVKLKVYWDKLWAKSIEEWELKIKEMERYWIDYDPKWIFVRYNWEPSVVIDTADMWFKVNYLKNWTDKVAINTLAFKVDNWDKYRIVSIWNMPNLVTKQVWEDMYLYISDRSWINYLLKLDTSIQQQPRWKVNPLSMSDKDYDIYMEVPDAYEKEIAWEQKYNFILENLEWFPDEVSKMIEDWASVSDIYNYMKERIWSSEIMQWIFDSRWLTTLSIEDMFNVYNEWIKLQKIITSLYKEWILKKLEIPYRFFDYYKYITWANAIAYSDAITEESFKKLFELWLWMFLDEAIENNVYNRFRNIYKDTNLEHPVSWAYYNLAQFEITQSRINTFLEKFEDYKEWLDLTTVDWLAEFNKRVRNWYLFATQVIEKEDIRNQIRVLRGSWVSNEDLPVNNMLLSLQTTTMTLTLLRDAKSKIKNNIKKWEFHTQETDSSLYRTFISFIESWEYWIEFVESMEKEYDKRLNEFISSITKYHTPKQSLKEIDMLQNILKKRARKLIKKIDESKFETPKVNEVKESVVDVRQDVKADIDDVVEETPDIVEKEQIHELDNKAKALVDKTEEWLDNSKEVKEYIDEKEAIENNASKEEEKEIVEYKEEEIKTEESQVEKEEVTVLKKDKKSIKIEKENEDIEQENNFNEQEKKITWNYEKIEDLTTEDIMWFDEIWIPSDMWTIQDCISWNTFLSLIEELSQKEWWKLPKWNIFLKQITKPTINKEWRTLLNNDKNIWLFLKSEEWMEYMLYSLYYHLAIPEKFIDKFNLLFWTELKIEDSFQDWFNIVYNTYKNYYWLDIEVQIWWMINIDRWHSSIERSFFTQETTFWKIDDKNLTSIWLTANDIRKSKLNQYIYDTWNIKNQSWNKAFINRYNKYIDNALWKWAYRSIKYKSWPMSIYEYWTLEKYNKLNKKKLWTAIDWYIEWNTRFLNISYWKKITWWNFPHPKWNPYYELLLDEENIKEFNEIIWWFDINQLHSPYYWNKIKELDWNLDNLKTTAVIDYSLLKANITKIKSLFKSWYGKIIVQWWDVNDIVKMLDKKSGISYDVNKYLDEVEIKPIQISEKDVKNIENITNKNAEDSLEETCK